MKTLKYTSKTIAAAVIILLTSCGHKENEVVEKNHNNNENTVELTEAQFKTAGIETGKVQTRTISGTIPASGMLDVPPQSKVSVSAPMGGFVKSTDLLPGSRVEKGQVVVVMQHPEYIQMQQDYLDNKSQLDFLKTEYDRQQELVKENVNARKTMEQAKANYFSTRARVEGLKAKLQMINLNIASLEKGEIQPSISLYAPISGYVTKVNTNIGAFVNPTDVLVEIVNTEHLHVELTVFEKDVPLLKIGQRVLFTLANETTTRVATVHLIGREIGSDRSVQIHCHIDKEDREMIPGMYLKAIVETDSAHVSAVPEDAVVSYEGKKFIYIEDPASAKKGQSNHHYRMVEVTVGESELGFVAVNLPQAFDMQSTIVTKGAFNLLAKMKNVGEEE